jgi:hypothetical protein
MAVHGKNTVVYFNGADLTTFFDTADTNQTVDTAETSTFGAGRKSYVTGLIDGTIALAGLFEDDDTTGVTAEFTSAFGSATNPLVTVGTSGIATQGLPVMLCEGPQVSHNITAGIADAVRTSADIQSSADTSAFGMRAGVNLNTGAAAGIASASETISAASSVDQTASSTAGMGAILHVVTNTTDDATTIKVQDSANDSTWADLITFTATPAATTEAQIAFTAGSVDRYIRWQVISGGSWTTGDITFLVSAARF